MLPNATKYIILSVYDRNNASFDDELIGIARIPFSEIREKDL
jgi:hypothetical protein